MASCGAQLQFHSSALHLCLFETGLIIVLMNSIGRQVKWNPTNRNRANDAPATKYFALNHYALLRAFSFQFSKCFAVASPFRETACMNLAQRKPNEKHISVMCCENAFFSFFLCVCVCSMFISNDLVRQCFLQIVCYDVSKLWLRFAENLICVEMTILHISDGKTVCNDENLQLFHSLSGGCSSQTAISRLTLFLYRFRSVENVKIALM